MGWVRSGFILMASPGPNESLHWQLDSQSDSKVTGGDGPHYPTFPSITVPMWKPLTIKKKTHWDKGTWEKKNLVGNRDGFLYSKRMRREKKSTSWTKEIKSFEQNKQRSQEMTSHSPLFPLLPHVVHEAASGCRDTMGSAHIWCSPAQWQVPYTDMMCLTKAVDDEGNTQKG